MLALQSIDFGDPGTDCSEAAAEAVHDALEDLAADAATADGTAHYANAHVLDVVAHALNGCAEHIYGEGSEREHRY